MNIMRYKGYHGSVEFSEEDCYFHGRIIGIKSLVTFGGTTAEDLVNDFHSAVDDYLAVCEAEGIEPERPYKGSFNVRISPELHQEAALCALAMKISLNSFVENAIRKSVEAAR